ncbi:unnamed protein product, partial [Symbiodinium natans]
MSGTGPADASAPTGGMAGVSLSHLPWQQIPRFVPGSTNVDDYGRRLQFLKALWPPEHVAQLGPRAALQVEGSAFQKISRIDPEQLRSEKGVQLIVEALGGAWGRTTVEDKYHTFEQAMFQVQQKPDESNDSYIARHDAFFEELLSKHIKLEEIRAYILLRHSQLSAEDKKRVVVESKGQLDYDTTVKAVRLLGSRFFHDLQVRGSSSHSRGSERTKVYDINFAEEDQGADEEVHYATEDVDEEALVAYYVEQNDEDAIYVAEFEDQIIETIQDSDLAPIFSAYQDARQRLREKAKARGYWPAKGRGKGKSKKGKSNHKGAPRGRTLAERIATSACRLCGQVGHWKRECPQRQDKTETTNLAHLSQDIPELPEIFQHLPEDTVLYTDEDPMTCYCPARTLSSFKETLARRLLMFDRSHRHQMQNGKQPPPANGGILSRAEKSESRDRPKIDLCPEDAVFVATVGSEGVLDTGASRTVIGGDRVKEVLRALPAECRKNVRKASSSVTFRFGNSGTLSSKHALLVPSPAGRMPSQPKQAISVQEALAAVDLDQQLSGEEDTNLVKEKLVLEKYRTATFVKPPGIGTLREWGEVVLPEGKHKQSTHAQVFNKDMAYAALMARKTSLTSPWALSFKNYCIARFQKAAEVKHHGETTAPKGQRPVLPKNPDPTTVPLPENEDSDDWKLCVTESEPSNKERSGKRASHASSSSMTQGRMQLDITDQDQMLINTRRALLLRELSHLEQLEQPRKEEQTDHAFNAPLYGPGSRYRLPTVDVIEVSASVGNVVGATIRKMGGKAVVLNQSKDIGTLKDSHGKLWQMMYMYEPNHLFVDVRQPWSRERCVLFITYLNWAKDKRRQVSLTAYGIRNVKSAEANFRGSLGAAGSSSNVSDSPVEPRRKFMFTHVLDEATLFQQADATGEAHWQLGRVEAHGKILKAMLTRMDQQEPINSDAEFRELPSRIDVETEGEAPVAQPEVLEGDSAPVDMDLGVAEGVGPAVAVVDPEQPEHEVSPTVSMQSVPEQETAPEPEAYDVPVPSDDEELLFGDTECFLAYPESGQAWEIVLHESEIKFADLPSASQSLHFAMLASAERKKRVEVRMRDLTAEERGLFDKAKDKEVRAWLDHRTVRRVAQGTLDDRQLMRCRWLLTWKPPEKEIPNDAPTLGKDARQLLIQKVVSNRWKLINFDISTAFLQGRGDGRKLGIRPPEELRAALGMKPEDQCQLDGGAYGRIDAPFLWFQTLKETLEKLGFLQSPFDACSFSLVTQDKQGKPKVHGVLGVHVDDGIGGGDAYFSRVIQQLRDIYSFGSYEEGDFTFTGIRFRQWDDCSVEMDQIQYIEKIQPIHVSRNR